MITLVARTRINRQDIVYAADLQMARIQAKRELRAMLIEAFSKRVDELMIMTEREELGTGAILLHGMAFIDTDVKVE